MAIGYAIKFANLPSETPYKAEHPGETLLTIEQAAEHLGIQVQTVKRMFNRVQNRLVPDAMTDDRTGLLFTQKTLKAWEAKRVENIKSSRAYMNSAIGNRSIKL